ncbi:phosphatase PAP2 family protein [Paenibacillus sp. HB172176]|uniref:phosphatase PAP2 family protein n=1 Tax=Paenibacillus sp. HB172176 TaxID=2493690 RepID=UPI001438EFF6|nr:phosphatase PAP2 family protein [Paenibacillus sp. HB172176]
MTLKRLFTEAYLLSALCALGFALIAVLIGDHKIRAFDLKWISIIQGYESSALTPIMTFFTAIGAGAPVIFITLAIMAVLFFVLHYRRELVFFAGVVIGSALLNMLLKILFHRARPLLHRIADANGYSFPSGHSMAAFTLYGILSFLLWKHARRIWIRSLIIFLGTCIVAMIGISRIYLGVHYPSDVFGGYLASGAWISINIWLYQRRRVRVK